MLRRLESGEGGRRARGRSAGEFGNGREKNVIWVWTESVAVSAARQ